MERLAAAITTKKRPAAYSDRKQGRERFIIAAVHDIDDLHLVDTAFESFAEHINNVVQPDRMEDWNIEISLRMVPKSNSKAGDKN
jgi:hypothetical protein